MKEDPTIEEDSAIEDKICIETIIKELENCFTGHNMFNSFTAVSNVYARIGAIMALYLKEETREEFIKMAMLELEKETRLKIEKGKSLFENKE